MVFQYVCEQTGVDVETDHIRDKLYRAGLRDIDYKDVATSVDGCEYREELESGQIDEAVLNVTRYVEAARGLPNQPFSDAMLDSLEGRLRTELEEKGTPFLIRHFWGRKPL